MSVPAKNHDRVPIAADFLVRLVPKLDVVTRMPNCRCPHIWGAVNR